MCVLLLDVFEHLLLRKTDVLKTCRKSKFIGNKILKKCTSFEEEKGSSYIRENVYFGIIIFSRLVREIKGFYQSSLENKLDSRDIVNVSPNILAKN